MKASHRTALLAATAAFTASGMCIADVGMADGKDFFTDFKSTKTRAQVQQEYLDARAQGTLSRGDTGLENAGTSSVDMGPRGPAGSRYQGRTREEVMQELREYRQTYKPNDPKDIYFGG